jgi:hypothetical protein
MDRAELPPLFERQNQRRARRNSEREEKRDVNHSLSEKAVVMAFKPEV